ncbi:MAG: amidohydrolase [Bacillota bacterium]
MSRRVLLKGLTIVTMNKNNEVIEDGSIAIENGVIQFVCETDAQTQDWQADETYEFTGKIAVPGFINAHTHAAMTLLRGYADDMALMEWLSDKIWPFESHLTPEDVYYGTLLACAEMIRSGTTTFADMYFHMDAAAEATKTSGLRALLSRGLVHTVPGDESAIADAVRFCTQWQGDADGRIMTCLAPHAPYTCPPEFLGKIVSEAKSRGFMIHTHLSETKDEIEQIKRTYGQSPVEYMLSHNVFSCPTLAAHCVHMDDQDMQILSDHGVAVAHNPGSNMKLASGVSSVAKMREKGIVVGLGTDGASSNNNLDMLEEARLCALLQKVTTGDPTVINANDALQMATIEGAKALRIADKVGSLEPRKQADIVIFGTDSPNMTPEFNATSNLVYSANAGNIEYVFVAGRLLLDQGKIISFDEQLAIDECRKRSLRLAREAKSN